MGKHVGYYIPARHHVEKAELDTLKQAAQSLEKLLISHGVTEEELFQEFHALRQKSGCIELVKDIKS